MGVKVRERNGAWWVFVDYNGKRKAKRIGTKAAAETVRQQIEARLVVEKSLNCMEKPEPKRSEPTLGEYVKTWREQAMGRCKSSSMDYYDYYQERHVLPRFGSLKLTEITRPKIKSMLISDMKSQNYAKNTINLAVASLRVILSAAVEEGIIPANPAIGLGKKSISSNKPTRESRSMEPQEAERFLKVALETCPDYYPIFLIALRAGLRQGEILGLKWRDFRFDKSVIRIERRWYHDAFDTPKGGRSREVEMSQQLRQVLMDLHATRKPQPEDLVFPGKRRKKTPCSLRPLWDHFHAIETAAGLSGFRFHELRHSFGSLLLDAGAPLSYVSQQMGHKNVNITATVYAHCLQKNTGFVNLLDSPSPQLPATQTQPRVKEDHAPIPVSHLTPFFAMPEYSPEAQAHSSTI